MNEQTLHTDFAPAERLSPAEVRTQTAVIEELKPLLGTILDSIIEIVMILNDKRQVVYVNRTLIDSLGISDPSSIYGMRPGEVLGCIHAFENEAGCGTTEFCRKCGAGLAILAGLEGKKDVRECSILRKDKQEALDLLVSATPFPVKGKDYVICSLINISDEKRRKALERIFFHDVLNTAGAVWGLAGLIEDLDPEKAQEIARRIYATAGMLIDEIKAQRELLAAESQELAITPRPVNTRKLISTVIYTARGLDCAEGLEIVADPDSPSISLITDSALLSRVVFNMTKNALEASRPGEVVTIGCRDLKDQVEFRVHNPGVMPRDAQLQVFQRSFSTKGSDRGLGAYSMKLLGEQYLKGEVLFVSAEGQGTTFMIRCPRVLGGVG